MANSKVTVLLTSNEKVELTTDTPDIGALVKKIVEIKDDIILDQVNIECDSEFFDKASFRQVIVDAIKDLIDSIQLEENRYKEVMKELKPEETDEDAGAA